MTPLQLARSAIGENTGMVLPLVDDARRSFWFSYVYPPEDFLEQPALTFESLVLWDDVKNQLGLTMFIPSIAFPPSSRLPGYFEAINGNLAPYIRLYNCGRDSMGFVSTFDCTNEKSGGLVPGYQGCFSVGNIRPPMVKVHFMAHLARGSCLLFGVRTLLHDLVQGVFYENTDRISAIEREWARLGFFESLPQVFEDAKENASRKNTPLPETEKSDECADKSPQLMFH